MFEHMPCDQAYTILGFLPVIAVVICGLISVFGFIYVRLHTGKVLTHLEIVKQMNRQRQDQLQTYNQEAQRNEVKIRELIKRKDTKLEALETLNWLLYYVDEEELNESGLETEEAFMALFDDSYEEDY